MLCGDGTAQCKAADVTINSITAARRAGTKIDFSVKVGVTKDAAAAGATTMATFLANADPEKGFAAILKKEAKKAGATAIAAIPADALKVTVTKPPGAVAKVTTVPTPTPTVASAASTTATVSLATLAFVALALQ